MLTNPQSHNLYAFLNTEVATLSPNVANQLLQEYSNLAAFDLPREQHEFFKKIFAEKNLNNPESLKATAEWKKLEKTLRDFNQPGINPNKQVGLLKTASQFINSMLMQHSFDYFLVQSYKQCAVLGLPHQATLNLLALIADRDNPIKINEFVKLLQKDIDQIRDTLEISLQNCDLTFLLKKVSEDDQSQKQRLAKLRQIILDGLQDNKPLEKIITHSDIITSSRFSKITPTFKEFEREILLQEYGEKAVTRDTKEITSLAQAFLNDKVPSETFHASLGLLKDIQNIKTSSVMPIPQQIEVIDKGKVYELILLEPSDPRNLYLGDLTNCCLKAGGNAEECVVDALTKPTSGMYVVQEKKSKKVCAMAYAFISQSGNLVFDSIEPLHKNEITEYGDITQKLFRQFTDQVLDHNQNIDRVCIGSGGNTKLCFKIFEEILQDDFFEKTQEGTYQYDDSETVFVLKHSAKEEQRLDALAQDILNHSGVTLNGSEAKILIGVIKEAILKNTTLNFYENRDNLLGKYIEFFKKDPVLSVLLNADVDKSVFSDQKLLGELIEKTRRFPSFNKFLTKDVDIRSLSNRDIQNTIQVIRHSPFYLFQWLIQKNPDLLIEPKILEAVFFVAAQNNEKLFIELALSYDCSPSPELWLKTLEFSVKSHADNMIEWLIKDKNIDLNKTTDDLLYLALEEYFSQRIFLKLLELGADPNRSSASKFRLQDSILGMAVRKHNKEIVSMLLASGADITPPKGCQALIEAARVADKDIFIMLIQAGIPFNSTNSQGEDIYSAVIDGFHCARAKRKDIIDFIKMALHYEKTGEFSNYNKEQESSLLQAIKAGHNALAFFLLDEEHHDDSIEAHPSLNQILQAAIESENIKFIEKLPYSFLDSQNTHNVFQEENESGETPLLQALVKNNMAIAHLLCARHLSKESMIKEIFFKNVLPKKRTQFVTQLIELNNALLIHILRDNSATTFLEQLLDDPKICEQIFELKASKKLLYRRERENLERLIQIINQKSAETTESCEQQNEPSTLTGTDSVNHQAVKATGDGTGSGLFLSAPFKTNTGQKPRREH